MKQKLMLLIVLSVLAAEFLYDAYVTHPAKANVTVFIRADGSVEGATSVVSLDNVTYQFADDINRSVIIIEKPDIVIDGSGYTLDGSGRGTGVNITSVSNVTIMNLNIKNFVTGVYLSNSSDNMLLENNLTDTDGGVVLRHFSNHNRILRNRIVASYYAGIDISESENNTISDNYIANGSFRGIWLVYSSGNRFLGNRITGTGNNTQGDSAVWCTDSSRNLFSGNHITGNDGDGFVIEWESENNTVLENSIRNNRRGIWFDWGASGNVVSGNTIADNDCGVQIGDTTNNVFFHNSFINNINQTCVKHDYANVWDDGYPSGGNYWSDHPCVDDDSDGICDIPYIMDEKNIDHYPIVLDSR